MSADVVAKETRLQDTPAVAEREFCGRINPVNVFNNIFREKYEVELV